MDWKGKAEKLQKSIQESANRREEESRRRKEQEEAEEEAKKFRYLAKHFKCNVCSKPSGWPYTYTKSSHSGDYEVTDWSRPGDLQNCKSCGRLTCYEHLHADICKKCAEKA